MANGLNNFLSVFQKALTQPLQFVTLGGGLFLSLLLPNLTVVFIPFALFTVLLRAWVITNDPQFMKTVLQPNRSLISKDGIKSLQSKVQARLTQNPPPLVRIDLEDSTKTLTKIQEHLSLLTQEDLPHTYFLMELVEKLVTKLLALSSQEQIARRFLEKESVASIQRELNELQVQANRVTDSVAKKQYQDSILLKNQHLTNIENIQNRLDRIDSYISRIKIELENANTFLAKLALQDNHTMLDNETDYLSQSLNQLSQDLDIFETENLKVLSGV